ncbi:Luciferase [Operophtera brumata]|uniref:Luciferase n=1 Tax=Operophtera brumata TaxID=104452 RepID=A0A0L7LG20_OPEBR|nr:Luciferase [Operophtera brumata]
MSNSKYNVYGKEVQVPAHLSFGKYILDRLRTKKDEMALEYIETNEKLSYKEFTQYAVNLSASLTRLEVRRGDTVAVGSEKRNEVVPKALAIDILQGFECIKKILTLDDPFDSIPSTRNLVTENVDVELFKPEDVLGQTDVASLKLIYEYEIFISKHSGVREASVVVQPDPVYGELPTAFMVRQPGLNVSEKELVDYIAEEVPPYMELKGGVKFIEEMPKNPRGKILRQPLMDMLKEL